MLLAWYDRHARQFIWREHKDSDSAPDPYVVLVSEVMLQQTQTARVQEKLPLFLQLFPSVQVLSAADNATIIKAWEGMGYNSRALRLRDCARVVTERHEGAIPSTRDELLALPGIGAYTASAILAFAYHKDIAVLDVNIRRVYSRLLAPMPTTADVADEKTIHDFAESVYPRGKASRWHQAVMDIGALFCTARAPKCSVCPLRELCASAGTMREKQKEKRPEPSWQGVPNRIWRGRIVQILRGVDAEQSVTVSEITAQLFPTTLFQDEESEQAEWLLKLLNGLERDGMIELECGAERSSQEKHTASGMVSVRLSSKS